MQNNSDFNGAMSLWRYGDSDGNGIQGEDCVPEGCFDDLVGVGETQKRDRKQALEVDRNTDLQKSEAQQKRNTPIPATSQSGKRYASQSSGATSRRIL